jgi:hypothetical protein
MKGKVTDGVESVATAKIGAGVPLGTEWYRLVPDIFFSPR